MRRSLIVALVALVAVAGLAPAMAAGGSTAPTVQDDSTSPTAQDDSTCEYPIERTDATGETITLEAAPERVVALMASDAQTAFEIGAGDRIVGMPVDQTTADLDAGDRTDVLQDDRFTVDVETVVGLEPDVVLAGNTTRTEAVDQLRSAGVTVYHFEAAGSMTDVRENVAVTGRLTGECEGSDATSTWMAERLDLFESTLEDEDRPLAYYAQGGGYTAGPGTFQHDILAGVGLENVAERAGIDGWGMINEETVVDEDPSWIVYGAGSEEPPVAESVRSTTAYQEEQFATVDPNEVSQPGPNVVYAVEDLVATVHPDAYDGIEGELADLDERYATGEPVDGESNGTNTETETGTEDGPDQKTETGTADATETDGNGTDDVTATETAGATEADGEDGSTDGSDGSDGDDADDSVPGFGPVGAAVALLASVALLARRE